eukprot:365679-Chlamydomonas_euryale.AAC.39
MVMTTFTRRQHCYMASDFIHGMPVHETPCPRHACHVHGQAGTQADMEVRPASGAGLEPLLPLPAEPKRDALC